MEGKNYKTVQITEEDKADLDRIYKKAGKFRSTLMHEAIEYLKEKYKLKDNQTPVGGVIDFKDIQSLFPNAQPSSSQVYVGEILKGGIDGGSEL